MSMTPEQSLRVYEQLKAVRASKTLELKPTKMLRQEIVSLDGTSEPLRLRYYQAQGIFHLLMTPRMVLGDGTGLGKCTVLSTKVLTSDGLQSMGSFAPSNAGSGEGFYEMDREVQVWTGTKFARVARFYRGGVKPTVRLTTRNGYQIECTLVHPLRVRQEGLEAWAQAGTLAEGDLICLPKSLPEGLTQGLHDSLRGEFLAVATPDQRRHFYDPIVKVEASEAEVADIEVDDPEHCYVANGILSHNTLQAVGALCYLWEREPAFKVLVVCPKSAIRQWAAEIVRFTHGVKPFVVSGTAEQRKAIYTAWAQAPSGAEDPKSVLIVNYHLLVRDWDQGIQKVAPPKDAPFGTQPTVGRGLLDGLTSQMPRLITIFDEATAFKNPSTKTHQTCEFLSQRSKRVWGLTATLLKNNLIEGFGIYKVLAGKAVFTSKAAFMNEFCVTELKSVKGGIKVPVIVGYKNLATFRSKIDPFFYGRPKHEVSSELPALTTREVLCEMSPAEDRKYAEALAGVLEMGDGDIKDFRETKALTSLIYMQEVVDSCALLGFAEGEVTSTKSDTKSAKEAALIDLLTEEFEGDKIIVYTRFEKLVSRLQKLLAAERIKSVRITGKEKDLERKKNQDLFQNLSNDTRVIFITDAASEAINLQAAVGMIFFDSPWSWGQYAQLLGRMIRIGSPHQKVLAIHLLAERPAKDPAKRETIDQKVIKKLRKKKGMIDQIIGEAAVGALSFDRSESDLGDLLRQVRSEA